MYIRTSLVCSTLRVSSIRIFILIDPKYNKFHIQIIFIFTNELALFTYTIHIDNKIARDEVNFEEINLDPHNLRHVHTY